MEPISWQRIVDVARGLSDEQARAEVEADPESARRLQILLEVAEAGAEQAPENWLNRAKALLPELPKSQAPILGKLVFSSAGASAGFRSGAAMARDLQFDLPVGGVDVRVEPLGAEGMLVVGVIVANWAHHARIFSPNGEQVFADEKGEFQLELTRQVERLQIENMMSAELYEVNLV